MTMTGGTLEGTSRYWVYDRWVTVDDYFIWGVNPFPRHFIGRCITCVPRPYIAEPPPSEFRDLIEDLAGTPDEYAPPLDPDSPCSDGRAQRPVTQSTTVQERDCFRDAFAHADATAGSYRRYVIADSLNDARWLVERRNIAWASAFREFFTRLGTRCSLGAGGPHPVVQDSVLRASMWTNDRLAPVAIPVHRPDGTSLGWIDTPQFGQVPPSFPMDPRRIRMMGCP